MLKKLLIINLLGIFVFDQYAFCFLPGSIPIDSNTGRIDAVLTVQSELPELLSNTALTIPHSSSSQIVEMRTIEPGLIPSMDYFTLFMSKILEDISKDEFDLFSKMLAEAQSLFTMNARGIPYEFIKQGFRDKDVFLLSTSPVYDPADLVLPSDLDKMFIGYRFSGGQKRVFKIADYIEEGDEIKFYEQYILTFRQGDNKIDVYIYDIYKEGSNSVLRYYLIVEDKVSLLNSYLFTTVTEAGITASSPIYKFSRDNFLNNPKNSNKIDRYDETFSIIQSGQEIPLLSLKIEPKYFYQHSICGPGYSQPCYMPSYINGYNIKGEGYTLSYRDLEVDPEFLHPIAYREAVDDGTRILSASYYKKFNPNEEILVNYLIDGIKVLEENPTLTYVRHYRDNSVIAVLKPERLSVDSLDSLDREFIKEILLDSRTKSSLKLIIGEEHTVDLEFSLPDGVEAIIEHQEIKNNILNTIKKVFKVRDLPFDLAALFSSNDSILETTLANVVSSFSGYRANREIYTSISKDAGRENTQVWLLDYENNVSRLNITAKIRNGDKTKVEQRTFSYEGLPSGSFEKGFNHNPQSLSWLRVSNFALDQEGQISSPESIVIDYRDGSRGTQYFSSYFSTGAVTSKSWSVTPAKERVMDLLNSGGLESILSTLGNIDAIGLNTIEEMGEDNWILARRWEIQSSGSGKYNYFTYSLLEKSPYLLELLKITGQIDSFLNLRPGETLKLSLIKNLDEMAKELGEGDSKALSAINDIKEFWNGYKILIINELTDLGYEIVQNGDETCNYILEFRKKTEIPSKKLARIIELTDEGMFNFPFGSYYVRRITERDPSTNAVVKEIVFLTDKSLDYSENAKMEFLHKIYGNETTQRFSKPIVANGYQIIWDGLGRLRQAYEITSSTITKAIYPEGSLTFPAQRSQNIWQNIYDVLYNLSKLERGGYKIGDEIYPKEVEATVKGRVTEIGIGGSPRVEASYPYSLYSALDTVVMSLTGRLNSIEGYGGDPAELLNINILDFYGLSMITVDIGDGLTMDIAPQYVGVHGEEFFISFAKDGEGKFSICYHNLETLTEITFLPLLDEDRINQVMLKQQRAEGQGDDVLVLQDILDSCLKGSYDNLLSYLRNLQKFIIDINTGLLSQKIDGTIKVKEIPQTEFVKPKTSASASPSNASVSSGLIGRFVGKVLDFISYCSLARVAGQILEGDGGEWIDLPSIDNIRDIITAYSLTGFRVLNDAIVAITGRQPDNPSGWVLRDISRLLMWDSTVLYDPIDKGGVLTFSDPRLQPFKYERDDTGFYNWARNLLGDCLPQDTQQQIEILGTLWNVYQLAQQKGSVGIFYYYLRGAFPGGDPAEYQKLIEESKQNNDLRNLVLSILELFPENPERAPLNNPYPDKITDDQWRVIRNLATTYYKDYFKYLTVPHFGDDWAIREGQISYSQQVLHLNGWTIGLFAATALTLAMDIFGLGLGLPGIPDVTAATLPSWLTRAINTAIHGVNYFANFALQASIGAARVGAQFFWGFNIPMLIGQVGLEKIDWVDWFNNLGQNFKTTFLYSFFFGLFFSPWQLGIDGPPIASHLAKALKIPELLFRGLDKIAGYTGPLSRVALYGKYYTQGLMHLLENIISVGNTIGNLVVGKNAQGHVFANIRNLRYWIWMYLTENIAEEVVLPKAIDNQIRRGMNLLSSPEPMVRTMRVLAHSMLGNVETSGSMAEFLDPFENPFGFILTPGIIEVFRDYSLQQILTFGVPMD